MSEHYSCMWDDCAKNTGSPRSLWCSDHRALAWAKENLPPRTTTRGRGLVRPGLNEHKPKDHRRVR